MQSLVIDINSKEDYKFVSQLLKKLGITARNLTKEEKADIGLYSAIQESKNSPSYTVEEAKEVYKSRAF